MATPEGLLVIDKPVGLTSFDVIRALRPALETRALGHTGTLDPTASGVLCVCVGWALKLIRFLDHDHKVYRAVLKLGEATDTDDAEGRVIAMRSAAVTRADIEAVLPRFTGEILQRPPAYSAIKQAGRRAYQRARRGEAVHLEPRPVRVDGLDVEGLDLPFLDVRVVCGTGTYIRSLARDIGEALGCGAHLAGLRRLENGPYTVRQAVALDELLSQIRAGRVPLVDTMDMLAHLPRLVLPEESLQRLRHGQRVVLPDRSHLDEGALVRVADAENRLVAVGRVESGRTAVPELQPVKTRPGAS